jgi:CRISPR-associated protein Csx17
VSCRLSDISAFVRGDADGPDTDEIAGLARALSLIQPRGHRPQPGTESVAAVPASYAALALVHHGVPVSAAAADGPRVRRSPEMLSRAIAGDGPGAMELAVRRLRSSGVPVAFDAFDPSTDEIRRAAAALAFPLHPASLRRLRDGLRVEPERHDVILPSLSGERS